MVKCLLIGQDIGEGIEGIIRKFFGVSENIGEFIFSPLEFKDGCVLLDFNHRVERRGYLFAYGEGHTKLVKHSISNFQDRGYSVDGSFFDVKNTSGFSWRVN